MLMLAASTAIVAACSTAPDRPVIKTAFMRPQVPAAAREPCPEPVAVPDRRLSQQEVVSLWGRDRAALRMCEPRRRAAVEAVDTAGEGAP